MCANILPDAYQSSDASRMFLGFFIVAALDLLDVLDQPDLEKPIITSDEREKWSDWIYSCQVPDGQGFRGFPGTDLGDRRNATNQQWDPGNLPNTFFALTALLVLGDDLGRVRRQQCLGWLPRLQRSDGSFGEILGPDGEAEGGRDLRYCCCAAGIAYILQDPGLTPYQPAFNEEKLVDYILSCQDYTGGFGESQLREPHSGLNYCAIGTLELLRRLGSPVSARAALALENQDGCVRWLLERQTAYIQDEESDEDEDEEVQAEASKVDHNQTLKPDSIVGFNGRDNKIADTCYCFWNSGALAVCISVLLSTLLILIRSSIRCI